MPRKRDYVREYHIQAARKRPGRKRDYGREYRIASGIDDEIEVGLGEVMTRHRRNIEGSDQLLELLQYYHSDNE